MKTSAAGVVLTAILMFGPGFAPFIMLLWGSGLAVMGGYGRRRLKKLPPIR